MEREKPYNTKELAKETNLTDAYIRYLCIGGKLQAEKFGRDWAIPADVGQRFIAERRAKWSKF